jgi:N utilization substance protein A
VTDTKSATMELLGDVRAFVRQLSRDKGLEQDTIKEAIEQAIIQASRKSLSGYEEANCTIDLEQNKIEVTVPMQVVAKVSDPRRQLTLADAKKIDEAVEVDGTVQMPITADRFGRIAAQHARQYVIQRLRDAERLKLYEEYKNRVGELITAQVARTERREIIVSLPTGEGSVGFNEVPNPNRVRPGDRLKLIITGVNPEARGHMITLSRNHPNLVSKLFEQEVPEISDGVVEVLGVAREPGIRSKIAVHSKNPDVDPVGACVGMKGSRVQMVVRELDGERIDIVQYDPDAAKFIATALQPAKIVTVICNTQTRAAEVLVARGNLQLAIGRRGQNARLAAKLTGWKIDIRSEEEDTDTAATLAHAEIERRYLEDFLRQLEELSDEQKAVFGKQDLNSVQKIAEYEPERLARIMGSQEVAGMIREYAADYLAALQQMHADQQPVVVPEPVAAAAPVAAEAAPLVAEEPAAAEGPVAEAEPAAEESAPSEGESPAAAEADPESAPAPVHEEAMVAAPPADSDDAVEHADENKEG